MSILVRAAAHPWTMNGFSFFFLLKRDNRTLLFASFNTNDSSHWDGISSLSAGNEPVWRKAALFLQPAHSMIWGQIKRDDRNREDVKGLVPSGVMTAEIIQSLLKLQCPKSNIPIVFFFYLYYLLYNFFLPFCKTFCSIYDIDIIFDPALTNKVQLHPSARLISGSAVDLDIRYQPSRQECVAPRLCRLAFAKRVRGSCGSGMGPHAPVWRRYCRRMPKSSHVVRALVRADAT